MRCVSNIYESGSFVLCNKSSDVRCATQRKNQAVLKGMYGLYKGFKRLEVKLCDNQANEKEQNFIVSTKLVIYGEALESKKLGSF